MERFANERDEAIASEERPVPDLFELAFNSTVVMSRRGGFLLDDAAQYIQAYVVLIMEPLSQLMIGQVRFNIFRLRDAHDDGVDVREMLQHDSHASDDLLTCLLLPSGALSPSVLGVLSDKTPFRTILLIDWVEVHAAWAGKSIGVRAIERIQWLFGQGHMMAALKVIPTMSRQMGGLPREALVAHYRKIGFCEVPGTDYMVMAPSNPC